MSSVLSKIDTAVNEETAKNLDTNALNDKMIENLGVDNLFILLEKSDYFLPIVVTREPELVSDYLKEHGINEHSINFLGNCYEYDGQLYEHHH